jgi:hypothetical protein
MQIVMMCIADEHKQTHTILLRVYRWVFDGVQEYVSSGSHFSSVSVRLDLPASRDVGRLFGIVAEEVAVESRLVCCESVVIREISSSV